ncbi:hypothetical protein AB0P21_19770 [Kribbella sp. NPDC056861]
MTPSKLPRVLITDIADVDPPPYFFRIGRQDGYDLIRFAQRPSPTPL